MAQSRMECGDGKMIRSDCGPVGKGGRRAKLHLLSKWYGLQMIQQEAVAVEPRLETHSVWLASGEVLHATL